MIVTQFIIGVYGVIRYRKTSKSIWQIVKRLEGPNKLLKAHEQDTKHVTKAILNSLGYAKL